MLTSEKEELFMHGTNAELIEMGLPVSSVLPGNTFWKSQRIFRSNTSIVNFDPVTTNRSGSAITLNVTKADPIYGSLGGIAEPERFVDTGSKFSIDVFDLKIR